MKKISYFILINLCLILFFSCNKDINQISEEDKGLTLRSSPSSNPYTVTNMITAWANVRQKLSNNTLPSNTVNIRETHTYIRFKPTSQGQLDTLEANTTLDLYPYPLDVELTNEQMESYKNAVISPGQPIYRYCTVPTGSILPGIPYDVLSALYIPEKDELLINSLSNTTNVYGAYKKRDIAEMIEDEALWISGNLDSEPTLETRASKWRPAGRIRLWDHSSHGGFYIGAEGAKVKCRRFVVTHTGIADVNGNFSCDGEFRHQAHYRLEWNRDDFSIMEGWLNNAEEYGPQKKGDWNRDYSTNPNDWNQLFNARLFKAAHHYYHKDIQDLRRPPQNTWWKKKMRIRAHYALDEGDPNGYHAPAWRFVAGSQIHVYRPNRGIIAIFATTIHELAHASHWRMDKWHYNNGSDKLVESWATGVQYAISHSVWGQYEGRNDDMPTDYTNVVLDMMDKATDKNAGREDPAEDSVEGYTIKQLEDALEGQTAFNGYRDNIKNLYDNATENNLDALFGYWD